MTRCAVLLVAAAAVLGGCGQVVTVAFVNQTDRQLPLEIQEPGEAQRFVAPIEPYGGGVKANVKADPDLLPAEIRWTAGRRFSGTFTVTEQTAKSLRIDLKTDGASPPYPWTGSVRNKRRK